MSTVQSAQKFRLWFVIGTLLLIALGAVWLNQVMQRATNDFVPNMPRTEPDFYVEKFSYIRTSNEGQARYYVAGERLTHNPQDDSYDIQRPVVKSFESGRAAMTVRAAKAKIDNDNSEIHLYENVHLDRPATATSQPMAFKTEYLQLLPDDDVMKTDKPVEIIVGASRLTGVGMYANNATREFRLSSNVHGTYQGAAK